MRDAAHRYRLVYWDSVAEDDQPVASGLATAWLRQWLVDPAHRHEVMEAFGWLGPVARHSRGWLDERDLGNYVRPALERALESGELVLVERNPIGKWKAAIFEVPPEEVTKPKESAPTKTWIEFAVLDMAGEGVKDVEYEAVLADGTKKKGKTDSKGMVRFEEIEPGICDFTLTGLDGDAFESKDDAGRRKPGPAGDEAVVPVKPAFVELQLVDALGDPMADREFELTGPDGSTQKGKTDDQGLAKVEGLAEGDYEVAFPGLFESAQKAAS